jgi:hypothetical protein
MEYSRREMLLGALKPLRRLSGEHPVQRVPSAAGEPLWLTVGPVADFPPGSEYVVNEGRQIVVSLAEGIRAVDSDVGRRVIRPLRLEMNGTLSMDPRGLWPAGALLNVMTGNMCLAEED